VDVATGADALDDLLSEIAAFGEVEGAGLSGLLGEFAVADVGAEEGRSFEEAEPLKALWIAERGASAEERLRQGGDGCGVGP